MAKFKKGDRVEVIDQDGDPRARIGDKGTVVGINHLDDEATLIVGTDKGKQIEMFEWRFKLITTTMNDNDKVETTVANIKAAHAKGCSTGKAMIEALFPKVFGKENTEMKYDEEKIYATLSVPIYKLHRIGEEWAFIALDDSCSYCNGRFQTPQEALQSSQYKIHSFDSQEGFFHWCIEQTK